MFTANDIITNNNLDNATRNNTTGPGGLGDYEVHVDYDQNGNITSLDRMAEGVSNDMDEFTYNYTAGTNKLDYVSDAVTTTGTSGYGDIQNGQLTDNYEYHSDGSLRADEQEEIDYIDWYPNGKIKRIYRTSTSEQSDVYFEYDPMGMRTLKVEITRTGTTINAADDWKFTYYGTDANGITMAVYDMDSTNGDLHRIESMIYGGSRLGMNTENETVSTADDLINDCNNDGLNSAVIQFGAFTPNNGSVVEIIHESVVISTLTWDTGLTTEEQVQTMVDDINAQASGYTAYNVEVSAGSIYYIHIKEDVAGAFTGDLVVELDDSPQSTYIKRAPGIGECYENRILGNKFFELTNHLGNVMEVVSDRKVAIDDNTDNTTDWYEADVVSYSDYYPFGMEMPGRNGSISGGEYRFAFNGMETDKEVSGSGNSYTTQFRQYDPRLGRWKSLDPLAAQFPSSNPYNAFNNNPIFYVDPSGLKGQDVNPDKASTPKQRIQVRKDIRKKKRTDKNFRAKYKEQKKSDQNIVYRRDSNSENEGVENASEKDDLREGYDDSQENRIIILVYAPESGNSHNDEPEKQNYRVYQVRFKYEPEDPASTITYNYTELHGGSGSATIKPRTHDNPYTTNGDADYSEVSGGYDRFTKFKPSKKTKYYSDDEELTWSHSTPNALEPEFLIEYGDPSVYNRVEVITVTLRVVHFSDPLFVKVPLDGFMGLPNWDKAEIYEEYDEKKDGFWKKLRRIKKHLFYELWKKR